jgi:membrane fusion protein, multidrug efflux system
MRARVSGRRAHAGDNVKPESSLLVIVPLENVRVEANVLEAQIAVIQSGQIAEIKVDAYGSKQLYHGKVAGLRPGTGSVFAVLPTNNATVILSISPNACRCVSVLIRKN